MSCCQFYPVTIRVGHIPLPLSGWVLSNIMLYFLVKWFLAARYSVEPAQGHPSSKTSTFRESSGSFCFTRLSHSTPFPRLIDMLHRNPWGTNEYSTDIQVRPFSSEWMELLFYWPPPSSNFWKEKDVIKAWDKLGGECRTGGRGWSTPKISTSMRHKRGWLDHIPSGC